jgi:hypothetical protein
MWTLIIEFTVPVAGNELADPYRGTVRLATIPVTARGLPDSAARKLAPGKAVTIPVKIKNTGSSAEDFFVDPRLTSTRTYTLSGISPLRLPLPPDSFNNWLVPAQTTILHVTARASVPVMFDYQAGAGDPDLVSASSGDDAAGTLRASFITPGSWDAYPSEIATDGYPATGAKRARVSMAVTAVARKFDRTITSGPGDFWLGALDPAVTSRPFVIKPGRTRTIRVTIKPSGRAGSVVRGDLYVDASAFTGPVNSGSQVAEIPYAYKIG